LNTTKSKVCWRNSRSYCLTAERQR
jgi:hypothetical protein